MLSDQARDPEPQQDLCPSVSLRLVGRLRPSPATREGVLYVKTQAAKLLREADAPFRWDPDEVDE
jgi:hypothetical protein